MRLWWKYEKASRILTWGAILALLLAFTPVLPAGVAGGAGLLTLSPDEGRIGDLIEVDGAGFASDQAIQIYFSSNLAGVNDEISVEVKAYEIVGETTTITGGLFSIHFSVPGTLTDGQVPGSVTNGYYYLYAAYRGLKRIVAVAEFFVTGPIVLSPNRGRIGDWIAINGTGLKAGDTISIYFSSKKASVGQHIDQEVTIYQSVGTAPVATDGTLGGGVGFQIPSKLTSGKSEEDVHGGEYYFYTAYYATRTNIDTVSRFVVVDGEIQLEPAEGTVDTEVKIYGQGLRGNQKIMVKYDGESISITSGDNATDATGQFSCNIIVPESTSGYHVIVVSDVAGNKPEANFLVKPKIMLSPASVVVNQSVEVRGAGFGEVEDITLMVNGVRRATNPAVVTSNHLGGFTFSFTAPSSAANTTAKVEVTDKAGNKAEAELTVLPLPPTAASISLTPVTNLASPGYVGMSVTVDGTNFKPKTTVEITYGEEKTITVDTNSRGSFSTNFTIAPGPAGSYTITATDGTNTASTTFIMEANAPPPPLPLLPKAASAAEEVTYFDWGDVSDPSGVTYTLQIATDTEFTRVVLERKGLTASEYVLTGAEQLMASGEETPYYWRVKAIDLADNEGEWTPPVLFYVGRGGAPMANWFKFTLIGLGVVLVGVVAFWVRQVLISRNKTSF
jgi:hypothetical protein